MTFYERFRQQGIDSSQLGLLPADDSGRYFCTPRGAEIIGRAGVDGVHYCFVAGYGEMVFSVTPMNLPGEYVHPLARTFEDFLRLLLSCNSLDVMEQAYRMDRAAFDCEVFEAGFFEDGQLKAREDLQNKLGLTPMPEPYDYIKELQASFDYSRIPYTEEYTPWGPADPSQDISAPEWQVYYHGSFWGLHQGRDKPGQEITVNQQFTWGGNAWRIPAVYVCGAGLVMDICMEVEPERIRAWQDKWGLYSDEDGERYSEDEREQIRSENPLNFDFHVEIELNGRTMRQKHGSGYGWLPLSCLPNGVRSDYEIREHRPLMTHYRLDPAKAWSIMRVSIPWATKRKPQFKTFKLHLEQSPVLFPGPRFTVEKVGDSFPFTHPVTGEEHTFTVLEYERGKADPKNFSDEEIEYPCHYTAMTYQISPDIPSEKVSIQDCDRGDSPRRRNAPSGVRGSSCGILLAVPRGAAHAAVSSMHFEPVERVEWRMIFHEKTVEDMEIEISVDENPAA